MATDATAKAWYADVKAAADKAIAATPVTYDLNNGSQSLLTTSKLVVDRTYALGFMWQITGNSLYADRLWVELDAASNFPDWHPDVFLDTAEMTHAFAIGYDWLYDYWSPGQRAQLQTAIIEMGLKASLPVYASTSVAGPYKVGGNWAKASSNWNIVSNSGMLMGALAVAYDNSTLSSQVMSLALSSLPNGISEFGSSGGYPEGPAYWQYSTDYLTTAILALRSATGGDYGIAGLNGVSQIGYFPQYITGPTGNPVNFGDAIGSSYQSSSLLGLGKIFDNPSFRYLGSVGDLTGNIVQRLLWFEPSAKVSTPSEAAMPRDKYFSGAGLAAFRSSWTDPDATFVTLRTRSFYNVAHQHQDAGTFSLDSLGQTWAAELGRDKDDSQPGFYDLNPDGQRWDYYRNRAEGQNTLVIDPYSADSLDHRAGPMEPVIQSNDSSTIAIADLSSLYPQDVTSWKRGIQTFDDRQQIVVQDEVSSTKPFDALWGMHTAASISISSDGRSAVLSSNGQRMLARITSADNFRFSDIPAAPLPTSPNPATQEQVNGLRKLAVSISGGSGTTTLAVQFTPLATNAASSAQIDPVKPLSDWTLRDSGSSRATGLTIGGSPVDGFSPDIGAYRVTVPRGGANLLLSATSASGTVTLTQATVVPGIATARISESGKTPRTYSVYIDIGPVPISAVSSTSSASATTPQMSIDRSRTTYWSGIGDQTISWTLRDPQMLPSYQVNWKANLAKYTKYEFQTSLDNVTWSTRYDGSYSGLDGWQTVVPSTAPWVKYVRFVVHGVTGIKDVKFYNFNIRGDSGAPSTPRPNAVSTSGVPASMVVGQTANLSYSATSTTGSVMDRATLSTAYTTADPSVATVDSNGLVTATGDGSTRIVAIVTSKDGVTAFGSSPVSVQNLTRFRIYASADTYVQGGATSTTSFGTATDLVVRPSKDPAFDRIAFFNFDLSALNNSVVTSAVLNLNGVLSDGSGSSVRLDAHTTTNAWSEGTTNYTNKPALGSTVSSVVINRTLTYRQGDISAFVKSVGAPSSISLGLTQDSGTGLGSYVTSRESSSRPFIEVAVRPAPVAVSSASASSGTPAVTFDGSDATMWTATGDQTINWVLASAQPVKTFMVNWKANSTQHTK
ncbi:DNRLRE domain-containing protein, partial [Subtercola frigoramans]